MKLNSVLVFLLLVGTCVNVRAQISFETKYFGNSEYRDSNNEKVGNAKGSSTVYQADIKLPISVKMDTDSLPRIWGIQVSGAYAKLDNKNFPQNDVVVSDITNLQLTAFHLRSLNKEWSLLAFAGAGVYAASKPFSSYKGNTILASGGALFIKKINPHLQLGGGLALNNAFGYPMIFPALFLDYNYEGSYKFKVSMLNGLEASAGYQFNKSFVLNSVVELNGQLALLEKNGKDVMFTHQYIVAGLRPEIKFSKNITMPITVGINANRSAYFLDRNIKSIFRSTENDSHFKIAPYAAARLEISF